MRKIAFISGWITISGMVLMLGGGGIVLGKEPRASSRGISPENVADYIHAIIEADRTVYTKDVVGRLQKEGVIQADEHWEQKRALPLPAQFLQKAGRLLSEYLGPIATILVNRAASKVSDHAGLGELLASELGSEQERQAFLSRLDSE